jgi:hypothetical protein
LKILVDYFLVNEELLIGSTGSDSDEESEDNSDDEDGPSKQTKPLTAEEQAFEATLTQLISALEGKATVRSQMFHSLQTVAKHGSL